MATVTGMHVDDRNGVRVHHLDADGPVLGTGADTSDLLGNAAYLGVDVLVVPVERLHPDFFRLETGMAGELLHLAGNLRLTLAVVGDIGEHTSQSRSLSDFVREADRGRTTWFVGDAAALEDRLARRPARPH